MFLYIIISIICLAIGFFLGTYINKIKTENLISSNKNREELQQRSLEELQQLLAIEKQEKEDFRDQKDELNLLLTKNESEKEFLLTKLKEKSKETELLQEKFSKEFENLANKILEEKSSKFTEQNKENLKNILSPLQEKIKDFEQKVEHSQKENISIHSALKQQLTDLQNQNLRITKEAENLTKALKGDSKIQGNWGELVLEKVLEKSNLEKGREYTIQESFVREDGSRVIPDVIIHLPDGKKMIIDSKVSLTDYERFVNAEDEEKPIFLKQHINSIKRHIDQLSGKKYEDLYTNSPDFVLMFIPIEPAFAIALQNDDSLYTKAFAQNIVIVTPTTLLATLRTIDSMWTNQKQQENAYEISRQAGALYDKFEGFITDLIKIGKKMDEAKSEYGNAMNKLVEGKGNIVRSIEKLKIMGVKSKKSIPEAILKRAMPDDDK
ncbi:DNA recombination protein RmuC [Capnocytophaga cynodegmi]|uniref:DNA recombination protein RmuC homolog n=1 Tax=Capnocytophaga cynodegmi TaxID=28189 RepID=A0A0B7H8R5_9FLAO|nr:DNA recombination protein RmuC [Capnocytophaga cynodegmi]CEN34028.1 DNA recombination protein RmuC homolog [Capnocytophaga cynodegmi]CEN37708.1 DNA recombination protein RmuC homolog [Capnocytophaga cynodegmi]